MATNLAIDDALISEAQKAGKFKTKRETVTMALKEFIQRRKREEIGDLFDTLEYDPGYDYKRVEKAIVKVLVDTPVSVPGITKTTEDRGRFILQSVQEARDTGVTYGFLVVRSKRERGLPHIHVGQRL